MADTNRPNIMKKKVQITTKEMVNEALIELHKRQGVSLKKIYSFIRSTFELETLTKMRLSLIKKHLHNLQDTEQLVIVTGRGFSGHFKLANKANFLKEINETSVAKRTTIRLNAKSRNEPKKRKSENKNNVPIEDTSMAPIDLPSTPYVTNAIVPGAPEVSQNRKFHEMVQEDEISTPRSSLPKKNRRLYRVAQ